MATDTIQKTERQYYIDWLRILLIISVFLFHIGMIFNTWTYGITAVGFAKQYLNFDCEFRKLLIPVIEKPDSSFSEIK